MDEPVLATAAPPSPARIAGAWRRIGASLVDGLLLAAVGMPLGLALGEAIAPAGGPARLLGLLVAVPYFAILGSCIGGGQTLGKRIARIRIVDAEGAPLSLGRSTARALLLALPWFLNGLRFRPFSTDLSLTLWFATVITAVAVFGLGAALVVVFLLNRRTRQSVHDLAVGSFVVAAEDIGHPVAEASPPIVARCATAWMVLVAVAVGIALPLMPRFARLPFSHELVAELAHIPGVQSFTVRQSADWAPGTPIPYVQVVLWYHGPPQREEQAARAAAALLLRLQPSAPDAESVDIRVITGWDIGIASITRSKAYVRRPDQWRRELGLY